MPNLARSVSPEQLAVAATLVVLLAIGLWLLVKARSDDEATSPDDKGGFFDAIRQAYEEGEIDEAQYQRIRDRLAGHAAQPDSMPPPTALAHAPAAADEDRTPSAGEPSNDSAKASNPPAQPDPIAEVRSESSAADHAPG